MNLPNHETRLSTEPRRNYYPSALRDAAELLVEEQPNLVPVYLPHNMMNFIEAVCIDAERGGEEAGLRKLNAVREIDVTRGNLKQFLRGMKEYGTFNILEGMFLSRDFYSDDPAISSPDDPRFSFRLKPKQFDLGLTGRLLEDGSGKRFQERLVLEASIYDAFDLAETICPKRIVAVDRQGREIVVYENHKAIGKLGKSEKGKSRRDIWVFEESQANHWMCPVKVLQTGGLKVVNPDFYERIKRYDNGSFCLLFGHVHKNLRDFLFDVTERDEHLLWDICLTDRSENTPLVDCKSYEGNYAHGRNRLHLMPNKAVLDFGRCYLYFDESIAIQALMSLGDIVTDIWLNPLGRRWDAGWDIVYDKRRRIEPEKPVRVFCEADMERYPVLKDSRSRLR